ncbi:unnamed protein product (macronuclear) [Paramecium tetraurelia]|uniref:Transmembrane protein n=1 Tax=Paramecium tetraurelia TaxID=5888 RepID=A0CJD1_PARTE|nr:uncharacterized protein GSPATT00000609001 [Paramecium tetraurelia]CAK70898.1 unnamed protein product [Paramecium tetraurelia]|eukprot:XP_001438295.1 hypothetical protein (macronuclear) [Paramecium tetraurelia strain d4-2]
METLLEKKNPKMKKLLPIVFPKTQQVDSIEYAIPKNQLMSLHTLHMKHRIYNWQFLQKRSQFLSQLSMCRTNQYVSRTLQKKNSSSVQDATINAPNKYVNALKVPKQITKPILKFDMMASTKSRANGEIKWLIPNCIGQIKVKLAQKILSQNHILSYKCCMLCSSLQSKTNNRAYRKNNNKLAYLCVQTFFVYLSQFIQAFLFYSNLTQN